MKSISKLRFHLAHKFRNWIPEKTFLQAHCSYYLGYNVNLDNPQTFNEKLNWLKLHDHNPIYSKMVDKYEVKRIVEEKIGKEYVVPCLGVWNNYEDIPFDNLPNQFVLKPTHQSGVCVCKDKSSFDFKAAKRKIDSDVNRNYYNIHGEWAYKNTPPRVLADKYLDDKTGNELRDFKFWCFNGTPKVMYMTIKGKNIYENFYDMEFNSIDINHGFPRHTPEFEKPLLFDKMKELAVILSDGIPFVRVDFFCVGGQIYFGEYTFYDWAGIHPFVSYEQDLKIGSWLTLPKMV